MNAINRFPCKAAPIALAVALTVANQTANAAGQPLAPWLTQMGLTTSVLSTANWGKGQILGVVDTGIVATNAMFVPGQVSLSLSSCAAVTFRCANGATDNNSHGTTVASIAAASGALPFTFNYAGYNTLAGSQLGVAPAANIVAEKVLSASGSGYSTDVANGIVKAANAGVGVINLSLGSSVAWDAETVAAVNYAASKGAFIVWAGGNSAAAFASGANSAGLTAAAINHLVIVGSVNSKNVLSVFSNKAGTGSLVDTTGAKTAYYARWIMAPGENIIAPIATAGPSALGLWSGTSMSAPLISGSLILLESAWPILKTNGTAANLLLGTATDLGAKGVDTTYGYGLVNLTTAFNPYGALMVTQANGKSVAITNLTGSLITGGALGSLPSVQSKLANYTALDGYLRNYSVNLSRLILVKPSAATLNIAAINAKAAPNKMAMADGGELQYLMPAMAEKSRQLGAFDFREENQTPNRDMFALMTDKQGTTMAFASGNMMPVAYAYTKALYGSDNAAMSAGELSTHLAGITQGGVAMAYGIPLSSDVRFAAAYSGTPSSVSSSTPWDGAALANSDASSMVAGLTYRYNETVQFGATFQSLNENHGLLGSTYSAGSPLSLGNNSSSEIGISALVSINDHNSLYLEASQVDTGASHPADGSMFGGTTAIHAQSFGVSYMGKGLFLKTDKLTLSMKQPLRVSSGAANLAVTNIDPITGVATTGAERVSLTPSGREIDYKMGYTTPLSNSQSLGFDASYIKDAENIAGNGNKTIGMNWTMRF